MFKKILASAALAASLLLAASPGEAKTCKSEFVTGIGHWRLTKEYSRLSAIHAWKVWAKIKFGSKWDTWSRAEDKSDTIDVRYVGAKQYQWTVRARPCRR